ncbi:response regulator transcription factor [Terriglobus albidus]|uniref:Response regulator transcription factor n=1 Tax=Terriglobus albidus TaxID=1592106 RepID=A0A5B9EJ35_9BACT|nr:response regulator [Terriglobus albidus]QEE30407.1 response regulator transcription factor [Terriglobus albidus]
MSARQPIVYIVDDDYRVREALQALLASAGYEVVVFDSAASYLNFNRPDRAACLILDLDLPGMNGLELQRKIAGEDTPPIVFLTGHGDIPSTVKAMKAGATEFLSKPFDDEELLRSVEAGLQLDETTRARFAELDVIRKRYALLTPREREVLPFVIAGLLNKQTAWELGTSEITIRIHRGQIMKKMEAESLADLVRLAARLGIEPLSSNTKR